MLKLKRNFVATILTLSALAAHADEKLFNGEVVSGKITIDFRSRQDQKADEYVVDLKVLGTPIQGKVIRGLEVAGTLPSMNFNIGAGATTLIEGKGPEGQIIQSVSGSDQVIEVNSVALAGVAKFSGRALVDGTLTYKGKGELFVPDLIMSYPQEKGQTINEIITGNIKWIKAESKIPNTALSRYEINIFFNRGQGTDSSLKGTVTFTDTLSPKDPKTTFKTVADYRMTSKNLSRDQITNFMKLWLLLIGPLHDD